MTDRDPSHAGKPIGLSMLVVAFGIGMVLLTLFFNDRLSKQQNPNQQPITRVDESGIPEVQLLRNRQGHYVVDGLINGQEATFLLDTGATDVVMSEELAQRAGLERGLATQAMTANGVITVYSTVIEELTLGNIILPDVRASINPAMSGAAVLLGMSALRHIEFSQRGETLTLRYVP